MIGRLSCGPLDPSNQGRIADLAGLPSNSAVFPSNFGLGGSNSAGLPSNSGVFATNGRVKSGREAGIVVGRVRLRTRHQRPWSGHNPVSRNHESAAAGSQSEVSIQSAFEYGPAATAGPGEIVFTGHRLLNMNERLPAIRPVITMRTIVGPVLFRSPE